MEEKKNIAITLQEAREWYKSNNPTLQELALKAFSKEELEKQGLPKTWEEYCIMHSKKHTVCYYLHDNSEIGTHHHTKGYFLEDRNLCQTKKDAEAFRALMQLRALWHDYVGDFEFGWKTKSYPSIVRSCNNKIDIYNVGAPHPFGFPTRELAEEFCINFKDLLEIAKPLI